VRPEVQVLTPEQAGTFLKAIKEDRLQALYMAALSLGLRQGEALGLRWQDVDIDQRTLRINHALQRVDGEVRLVEPKTIRSRRTLPLPESVIQSLRSHRVRQKEERLKAGEHWQEGGFVFTTTIGTPLDPRNVLREYHAALKRTGLPRFRFHDLRHSCASLLLAQGVQPRTVMEILGHSQISLTMNTYAHVMPSMMRDAADAMDKALGAVK
jgi:integrase